MLFLLFRNSLDNCANICLLQGGTLHKSEILKDSDSDDSDESVERDLSHKLTDEELFKLCGGRTAHK